MNSLTAKNKIYALAAVWLVLVVGMVMYGFPILDRSNEALVTKHNDQQKRLASLEAEVASYNQAQSELDKVTKQKYLPDQLFSRDISLVKELRTLEDMGLEHGVNVIIGGLGGTVKNAQKAKTQSELYIIPYSITVTGNFDNSIQFLQHMENLRFITTINSVSVSALSGNEVSFNMNASFYLQK